MDQARDFQNNLSLNATPTEYARYFLAIETDQKPDVSWDNLLDKMPYSNRELHQDLEIMSNEGFLEGVYETEEIGFPQSYRLTGEAHDWVADNLDWTEEYIQSLKTVLR